MDIEVVIYTTDSADILGAIHARAGRPIEIRLIRGITTNVEHVSADEALRLAALLIQAAEINSTLPLCDQTITKGAGK